MGKTTLLKKLCTGNFDPCTRMTIGVDFSVKKFNLFNRNIKVVFWDFVGAQRFDFLRERFYLGADAMLLIGDLTRIFSFEKIDYFKELANDSGIDSKDIILVGAKSDLSYERCVNPDYMSSICENFNLNSFLEVSARTTHNMDVLFELIVSRGMIKKGLISEEQFESYREDLKTRMKEPWVEPHEKIVKKCWKCGRSLYFYEFFSTNPKIGEEQLIKLWMSPYVELLCCSCFREMNNMKKEKKSLVMNIN